MGLELVTGYSGKPHVTSYQQAMVHAGITGMDNAVFGYVGQALKAVVTSANNVRIYDGAGMIGGKIFCVNKGEYVDVPIANGISGKYRADIICVKYTKDTSTGVEEVEFQVVKGTAGTSYVEPAVVKNDLYSQGTIASQEKFYRVKLNGLAIEAVEPLFEKVVTNAELNSKIKLKDVKFVYGTVPVTGTSGELGSYYGTINLENIPSHCVAIIPLGTTCADEAGYPGILAPHHWERFTIKNTVWNVIASRPGTYGYGFALILN